jgi:hypothetical protein
MSLLHSALDFGGMVTFAMFVSFILILTVFAMIIAAPDAEKNEIVTKQIGVGTHFGLCHIAAAIYVILL